MDIGELQRIYEGRESRKADDVLAGLEPDAHAVMADATRRLEETARAVCPNFGLDPRERLGQLEAEVAAMLGEVTDVGNCA